MSNEWIAHYAIASFSAYMVETSSDRIEASGEPSCLADFIEAWLRSGHGVSVCAGNYQTFIVAVMAIVDAWLKDPGMLDYVPDSEDELIIERRVTTFLGEQGARHRALDPHFFGRCVFEQCEARTSPVSQS